MFIFSLSTVFGTGQGTVDPSKVTKPSPLTTDDTQTAIDKVKPVVQFISGVGVAVSVITLVVLGIKYMVGSIEEKAEYKKSMIPYLIGAFLVFGISTVLSIIMEFTNEIFPTT
jgi:type IV secretory pathway VirB2 component (pilin)